MMTVPFESDCHLFIFSEGLDVYYGGSYTMMSYYQSYYSSYSGSYSSRGGGGGSYSYSYSGGGYSGSSYRSGGDYGGGTRPGTVIYGSSARGSSGGGSSGGSTSTGGSGSRGSAGGSSSSSSGGGGSSSGGGGSGGGCGSCGGGGGYSTTGSGQSNSSSNAGRPAGGSSGNSQPAPTAISIPGALTGPVGAIAPNPDLFSRVAYGTFVRPQIQAFNLTTSFLKSPTGHQLLSQTSEFSGAAAITSSIAALNPLLFPEAAIAALVFKGISIVTKAIDVGFNSDNPIGDITEEIIKLFLGKSFGPIYGPFINKASDEYYAYLKSRERNQ